MKPGSSTSFPTPTGRPLTTEEFARFLSLKSQSIRKRYSLTGSYHGVRPIKLPNRRLLWPVDSVEQFMKGGAL
jgi:hypothetical protein